MLKESKVLFKNHADSVLSNWAEMTKDELFNHWISEETSHIADAYMSAIIYKSWNLISSAYYKQQYPIATEQDCYDTFINVLYYIKGYHKWTEGEGSLAGDPDAFSKALSHCYNQRMLGFFGYAKRQKRSVNYNSSSLDMMSEDFSEGFLTPITDEYPIENSYLDNMIIKFFNEKNYIYAFILDAILNLDVFNGTTLNMRKMRKHLRNLDNNYCRLFAEKYNIKNSLVNNSIKYITGVSQFKMDNRIQKVINTLKNDKFIRKYYLGGIK